MPIPNNTESKLTRIGVFYDGNYFAHVSNYYLYQHERKARISIQGLHQFIIEEAAKAEESIARHCRIVDAHYFRGRLSANEAQTRARLYGDRVFDDVLMREGVVSHYLPLVGEGEKGVDVWFALEAFELAIYKRFDVSVLVAGDGDYLPLIRKLNTIGTRVMVVGWDFSFTDKNGIQKTTRVAQTLLDEATYPIMLSSIIDERSRRSDTLIENLFMRDTQNLHSPIQAPVQDDLGCKEGKIDSIKKGFGFIRLGQKQIFFHYTDVENVDFNDLKEGDSVSYEDGTNDKGACAKRVIKL
jgi:cold shock CspA family protein/uncharacterized LabA/DUF88 family protein